MKKSQLVIAFLFILRNKNLFANPSAQPIPENDIHFHINTQDGSLSRGMCTVYS